MKSLPENPPRLSGSINCLKRWIKYLSDRITDLHNEIISSQRKYFIPKKQQRLPKGNNGIHRRKNWFSCKNNLFPYRSILFPKRKYRLRRQIIFSQRIIIGFTDQIIFSQNEKRVFREKSGEPGKIKEVQQVEKIMSNDQLQNSEKKIHLPLVPFRQLPEDAGVVTNF